MNTVAVAVSGGRDSTALLHCSLQMARPLGLQVVALHVHHGLMPQADDWLAQVRRQARRWGAGFDSRRLQGAPAAGESVEAWARRGRYAALADMAQAAGANLVLLAHHRRDQAETWLLQALRGAGAAGLSAMPQQAFRQGLHWARPWLDQPREAIEHYVRRHRLRSVDDPSNADARLARSRLRLQVWPGLIQAFPEADQALAASCTHAQEAAALAAEVAALDLPGCVEDEALLIAPWRALPPARRANALRQWLARASGQAVAESLVQRLLRELPAQGGARFPAGQAGEWQAYRGCLRWATAPGARPALGGQRSALQPVACARESAPAAVLQLAGPGRYAVPGWEGSIEVRACEDGGVAAELLQGVQARPRQGGERFQLAPAGLPRSLKKVSQGQAVAAWAREGPLLFTQAGALLFVPWLGLDARCRAAPGTPQFSLMWQPATGPGQAAL